MSDTLSRILTKFNATPSRAPITLPICREGLAALFAELNFNRGAEIGVERGIFSATLCKANPNLHLSCIDAWRAYRDYKDHTNQSKLDRFHAETVTRLAPYDCEIIRDWSLEAVKKFEDGSLDWVYVDGNHNFQNVTNDIIEWSKKVRPGGIIAGHDYVQHGPKIGCHVKQVVDCYTYCYGIKPLFIITHGEGNADVYPEGNAFPSWMWVKP
jgi:predicted O-methyltransferase YrrM